MRTMLTLTITASTSTLLSNHHITDTLDRFTSRFNDLRDWCIIQLDVGTWEMSELETKSADNSISFTHVFTFNNQEDATAFRLVFDI